MGLVSLPILNKVGYRNYWQGSWYADIGFLNILTQVLYTELFFNLWMTDRFVSCKFLSTQQFQIFSSLAYKNVYFASLRRNSINGDTWILRYQAWYIFSPVYFTDYRRGGFTEHNNQIVRVGIINNFFSKKFQML